MDKYKTVCFLTQMCHHHYGCNEKCLYGIKLYRIRSTVFSLRSSRKMALMMWVFAYGKGMTSLIMFRTAFLRINLIQIDLYLFLFLYTIANKLQIAIIASKPGILEVGPGIFSDSLESSIVFICPPQILIRWISSFSI